MNYPDSFFQLQLDYANKISEFENIPLEDTLFEFTGFYKLLGISGWDFNKDDPKWTEFISHMKIDPSLSVIKKFCNHGRREDADDDKRFGCFSYDFNPNTDNVYIHFKPTEEKGSLSLGKMKDRLNELYSMFYSIRKNHPTVKNVVGFSWLYNLDAYRRLFPVEYFEHMKINKGWYKSLALWGQFIHSNLSLDENLVYQFLSCLQSKNNLNDLKDCFPFHVCEPEASIEYFYHLYGI